MQKDFDDWNTVKKLIHRGERGRFYRERELWRCALGVNVGFEEDGTGANYDRPVLIIRGFSRDVCFGVALTGRQREGPYYLPIGEIDGRKSSVILSQVRLIDTRRLIRRMTILDEDLFDKVCKAVQQVLFKGK